MTYLCERDGHAWMFGRDEIDLLEEAQEDIYQMHEQQHPPTSSMEHAVIREQMETEDAIEAELTIRWGTQNLPQGHRHQESDLEIDASFSVRDVLREQSERDPLYTEAFLWSQDVFQFAKEQYLTGDDRSRDMFRVYLNANMIPIKVSIRRGEEGEDAFSMHVIQKEYELACTYLERTLESLHALVGRGYDVLIPCLSSGTRLRGAILLALKQIGSREPFDTAL